MDNNLILNHSKNLTNEINLVRVLKKTLNYSRSQNYTGYDKADGMSSKILKGIPFESKWINLLFQEGAKRSPINIRPLLLVEKKQNYKGSALFAISNLNMFKLTEDGLYKKETKRLVEWLIENQSNEYEKFCGGHPHPIQGLKGKSEPGVPDIVDTSYGVKALLKSADLFDNVEYRNEALTASKFVFEDLGYREDNDKATIKYKPDSSGNSYTLNANALGARLLIDLYSEFKEDKFLDASMKILNNVVSKQTDLGGWMYTDPPSASHLSMDNYHNGFIIESILRYQEVTDSNRFDEELDKALKFYRDVLYNENGSPNWDEKNEYPKDTHSVAQGIITFTMAEDMEFAKKILDWTISNLYAGEGRFYYQKRRFYTKKFTLMRWCQAWMAYAISEYLIKSNEKSKRMD